MTKEYKMNEKFHELGQSLSSASPSCNMIDLTGFPGILVEPIEKEKFKNGRFVKISIDAEYFKSKFQDVLEDHFYGYIECEIPQIAPIIEDLIECLKNPEGK